MAHEVEVTRQGDLQDPWAVAPDQRGKVDVGHLSDKIAAAQKRLRDSRAVTATLESGELDEHQAVWSKDPVKALVHGLGLSNQRESFVFASRFLALEQTVAAQSELIVALVAEVEKLKGKRK